MLRHKRSLLLQQKGSLLLQQERPLLLAGLVHKALERNPRAKIVEQLQKSVRDEASLEEADDVWGFGLSREELKVAQENDHDCWELMNFLRKEAGLKHEQVSQHDQVRLRAAVGGHRTTKLQLSACSSLALCGPFSSRRSTIL